MSLRSTIAYARIHPAIGIARVGDSAALDGFFVGPEVPDAPALDPGAYKDPAGALKRQVARFRVYGYNADDEVVAELTSDDSVRIVWTVHLANKKASWYEFQQALDIPSVSDADVPPSRRRNASIVGEERMCLVIDPGPRSITGICQQGASFHFDGSKFFHLVVSLGELRTDESGRLLVFGGRGLSQSRLGTLPTTFANNDDWHDDVSDGPVDANVSIDGRQIPVVGAWVAVAPPNYAPTIKTVRTLYDLLLDRMIAWGFVQPAPEVSFQRHIRPIFERLTGLQWVNHGFASWFGSGAPFDVSAILLRLADRSPSNAVFRAHVVAQFRDPVRNALGKNLWPQFYGDALDNLTAMSPGGPDSSLGVPLGLASLSPLQLGWLRKWADGEFVSDGPIALRRCLGDYELQEQPAALDEASLSFCLADAFHPGCELTWPMRIRHLYNGPFRIKRKAPRVADPDFGEVLSSAMAVSPIGPLNGSAAGDLTKWMAVPWQTDTASCNAGYTFFNTSLNVLPTFWPARVPNTVLRETDFQVVMNSTLSNQQRLEAFHTRVDWFRGFVGMGSPSISQMITGFAKLGIVEERDGPVDVPGVPSRVWVETQPGLPEPGPLGLRGGNLPDAPDAQHNVWGGELRRLGKYGAGPT